MTTNNERKAIRAALAIMPRKGVELLRDAVRDDDPALVQHKTVATCDGAICGACLFAYPFWMTEGPDATEGDIVDMAVRAWFAEGTVNALVWFDRVDRDEMRRELLPLIEEFLNANGGNT